MEKLPHLFAIQYLRDHKLRMFRGSEEVLKGDLSFYDIRLPNTRFYTRTRFVQPKPSRFIDSYEELGDLGFLIISRKVLADEKWERGQSVIYELCKKDEIPVGENVLLGMPKGRAKGVVEYDEFQQRVRLLSNRAGPAGFGPWFFVKEKIRRFKKTLGDIHYSSYGRRNENICETLYNRWTGEEDKAEPVYIKEIPFMITDSNEVVCIPRLPDMPSIMITGQKGSGKSYCLLGLVSRFFWKFRYKVVVLNDSSRETGYWCFPNMDPRQQMILRKFNERPLPLPVVYLHPTASEDYEKLYMGDVGFDITIPFRDIVEYHKNYLKIGPSIRYFGKFKDKLKECKTQKEAEEFLDDIEEEYKVPANTANKVRSEFQTLFNNKITDISWTKQKPWRTSKNMTRFYNPVTACLHAGLIPVLETEFVSNIPELLAIYFRYYAGDIFVRQKQDPDFLAEQSEILMIVDECFTPNTMINTIRGPVSIRELYLSWREGKELPLVLSKNLQTGEFEYKRILAAMEKETREKLLEINLGVSKIKVTKNHKIHTSNGYVKAKNLFVGDLLSAHYGKNANEGFARIKSIKEITYPFQQKGLIKPLVYDLTIEDNHNYIICGKKNLNGILVSNCHNISGANNKNTGADFLLRRCVREGRPRRIGTILATQKFGELPSVIKDNTTYLIIFKDPGEATAIASQYNMGKLVADQIKDLEKHQCIAYTSDYFIIYDSEGNIRKSNPNEIFKGKTLPPYSQHKPPVARGEELSRRRAE